MNALQRFCGGTAAFGLVLVLTGYVTGMWPLAALGGPLLALGVWRAVWVTVIGGEG